MLKQCLFVLLLIILPACSSKQFIMLVDPQTASSNIVVVHIPENVLIKRIDDRRFNTLFSNKETKYYLYPGIHEVELKFEQLWELNSDDHDIVRSDVVKMNWELKPGTEYTLKFDNPNNYEASKKLANNFTPWLTQVARSIPYEETPSTIADTNNAQTTAPETVIEKEKPAVSESSEEIKEEADTQQLKQLKIWWSRSSKSDRQRFLNWITDSE